MPVASLEKLRRFREECVQSAEMRALFNDMATPALRMIELLDARAIVARQGGDLEGRDNAELASVEQRFLEAKSALSARCAAHRISVPDFNANDLLQLFS